ncbi:zinc-finger protein conserved [Leptomonas pyrrhocoris]|uniref:Zinc-finger protein conserved n=1 Tax=Leptomonas pyrrhocoris TaxID=157538 RepID=A0A0M9G6J2_LEPPY|nr:zinc-finger protein conserved [Leptomonas pyrrhocoris]KPA83299.1 zinc-finger protein conserved [Leptomonas pyrrhocoris]|eukprot:XP_015661738.1 zinc-finger protein conserved [Leptomonas pyrrhocoris]
MSRVITCGICFNVLDRPVTLECNHSFCTACVLQTLRDNGDNGFQCPLCATPYTELHAGNLAEYADHETEVYVEALAKGVSDPRKCQWCESAPATVQCAECMSIFCNDCSAAVHKNIAKRDHAVGKLSDSSKNYLRRCHLRSHEEYKAEFYCVQCSQVCCAYCLQVGPHREHRHVTTAVAAAEARQQMSRDLQSIVESKTRLERQAAEMNRVAVQYSDSYDSVENVVTERFEAFKQQLMQREVEVRRMLTKLRESGDASLTSSRREYLETLNKMNETLLQFRGIQNGGTDDEVLESHVQLSSCLPSDLPSVTGAGFKMMSLGDMTLAGLEVALDLQTVDAGLQQQQQRQQLSSVNVNRSATYGGAASLNGSTTSGYGGTTAALSAPLRLTFPVDDDVEATVLGDGVQLHCVSRGSGATQIGVRSKETFESLLSSFPEDRGVVAWRVRLDNISDSFIGVVEKTLRSGQVPNGFYWKPACAGVVDGQVGRFTSAVRRLPVCRNGDRVHFIYDGSQGTLRVVVNDNDDRGVIVADLHPRMAACFIFYPGEALTILF